MFLYPKPYSGAIISMCLGPSSVCLCPQAPIYATLPVQDTRLSPKYIFYPKPYTGAISVCLCPQAPISATLPVHKLGQMVMYDQYLSRAACSDFNVFDLDDVDVAFSRVQQLRYQQHVSFSGAGGRGRVPSEEGGMG